MFVPADVDCWVKFSRDNTYGQQPMAAPQQTQLSLEHLVPARVVAAVDERKPEDLDNHLENSSLWLSF